MNKVNPDRLPANVNRVLRAELDKNYEDISNSSPREVMESFLHWEGIIGYTETIVEAWEGIKRAARPEEPYTVGAKGSIFGPGVEIKLPRGDVVRVLARQLDLCDILNAAFLAGAES